MLKKKSFNPPLLIIVFLFSLLIIKLYDLQVIKGEEFSEISLNNYVRIKKIKPVRGEIFDSDFQPIVKNKPSFSVYVLPSKIKNGKKLSEFLARYINSSEDEIWNIIKKNRFRYNSEILIGSNISYDAVIAFSENNNKFPGIILRKESIRKYMYPNKFTGYTGFIDEFSWQYEDEFDYERNSKVGKSGLEKKYEERLRGKIGYNILQVDAKGRNLGFFENSVADTVRNGEDLILTIDNDFQQYCRTLFKKGQKGALIVMDIKTGGILSYEGYPEFDPNIFTGKLSKEDWDILNNNPDKPMFDRCVMGTYPPGSVFKPVIGTMILRTGKIDPYKDKFNCSGGLQVGNRFFKCWLGSGHGNVNLHTALQYSCDTYFYEVIKDYDLEDIADYTESNFLTVASGVDISSEQPGFFPSDYSHDKSGRNTSLGDLINLSIGQGAILVTPLQMCAYYNALGNKGIWIQPHFLYESLSESDHARLFVPEEKRLPASEKDIVIINKSLYAVVNSEKGTGRRAKLKGIDVWGKSGSAENHSGDTHAWFCGFAGKNMKPEISFTVFVENGGGGGKTAAPIAKKLIEFYFDNK